jgi:hypothetical protein
LRELCRHPFQDYTMRILLLRNASILATPPLATRLLTQLVRQARQAGHELRELVPHPTEGGNGLDRFRSEMRGHLDAEVAGFDPHIIHVNGIGILGHLALETGVPYLISAFGEEFTAHARAAVPNYAQQAVENAGRVLVDSRQARDQVIAAFGHLDTIVVLPRKEPFLRESEIECASHDLPFEWLNRLYLDILSDRHGLAEN